MSFERFVDKQKKLPYVSLWEKGYNRTLIWPYMISARRKLITFCIVLNRDNIFSVSKRYLFEYMII